jgi:arylsulfatase A-like enzyme
LTYLWLSDPDITQHRYGPGAPESLQAVRQVDAHLGEILDTLDTLGRRETTNIFVMSDHGFITHAAPVDLPALLEQARLKLSKTSTDVVCVDRHIYIENHDTTRIEHLVRFLQHQPWCGPIFTREGNIAGTFPLKMVGNAHQRSGDILYTPRWNTTPNGFEVQGTAIGGGVAGHGGISPFELHTLLFAQGPAFKSGVVSHIPSGNIDVAMTALHILGIPPSGLHEGRILHEAFASEPHPEKFNVRKETVHTEAGAFKASLDLAYVGDKWYLEKGEASHGSTP